MSERADDFVLDLDPDVAALVIGVPTRDWPGKCHQIAAALLDKGLVKGRLRYGHWRGPIEKGTRFAGRPLTHHGWIEREDGTIVDPTRYVFEGDDPYIYAGPNGGCYDAGGNLWRAENEQPAPGYDDKARATFLVCDEMTAGRIVLLLDRAVALGPAGGKGLRTMRITWPEACWLANLSLDSLGGARRAAAIYEALRRAGEGALIPIDNERLAAEVGS